MAANDTPPDTLESVRDDDGGLNKEQQAPSIPVPPPPVPPPSEDDTESQPIRSGGRSSEGRSHSKEKSILQDRSTSPTTKSRSTSTKSSGGKIKDRSTHNKEKKKTSKKSSSSSPKDKDDKKKKKKGSSSNNTTTTSTTLDGENNGSSHIIKTPTTSTSKYNKLSRKLKKDAKDRRLSSNTNNTNTPEDEISVEISITSSGSSESVSRSQSPKTPRIRKKGGSTTSTKTTTKTPSSSRTKMSLKLQQQQQQQGPNDTNDTVAPTATATATATDNNNNGMPPLMESDNEDQGTVTTTATTTNASVASEETAGFKVTITSGNISLWEMRQRFKREFPNEPVPSDTVLRQLYRTEPIAIYDLRERFRDENKTATMPTDDELRRMYSKTPPSSTTTSSSAIGTTSTTSRITAPTSTQPVIITPTRTKSPSSPRTQQQQQHHHTTEDTSDNDSEADMTVMTFATESNWEDYGPSGRRASSFSEVPHSSRTTTGKARLGATLEEGDAMEDKGDAFFGSSVDVDGGGGWGATNTKNSKMMSSTMVEEKQNKSPFPTSDPFASLGDLPSPESCFHESLAVNSLSPTKKKQQSGNGEFRAHMSMDMNLFAATDLISSPAPADPFHFSPVSVKGHTQQDAFQGRMSTGHIPPSMTTSQNIPFLSMTNPDNPEQRFNDSFGELNNPIIPGSTDNGRTSFGLDDQLLVPSKASIMDDDREKRFNNSFGELNRKTSRRGSRSSTKDGLGIDANGFDQIENEDRFHNSFGDLGSTGSFSHGDDRMQASSSGQVGRDRSRRGRRKVDDDLQKSDHNRSSSRGKSNDRSRRGRRKVDSEFQDDEDPPSKNTHGNDRSRRGRRRVDGDTFSDEEEKPSRSSNNDRSRRAGRKVDVDSSDDEHIIRDVARSRSSDASRRGRRRVDGDIFSDEEEKPSKSSSTDRSRRAGRKVDVDVSDDEHAGDVARSRSSDGWSSSVGGGRSRSSDRSRRGGRRKVDADMDDEDDPFCRGVGRSKSSDGLESISRPNRSSEKSGRTRDEPVRGVARSRSSDGVSMGGGTSRSNDKSRRGGRRKVDPEISDEEDEPVRGVARSRSSDGLQSVSGTNRSMDRSRRGRRRVDTDVSKDDLPSSPVGSSRGVTRNKSAPMAGFGSGNRRRSHSRDRLARERGRMTGSSHRRTSTEDKNANSKSSTPSGLDEAISFATSNHDRGSFFSGPDGSDVYGSDDDAVVPSTSMFDEFTSQGESAHVRSPGISVMEDFVVADSATANPFAAATPRIAPSKLDEIKELRMPLPMKGDEKEKTAQRQEDLLGKKSGHKSRKIKFIPKPKEKKSESSKAAATLANLIEGEGEGDGFLSSLAALDHAADTDPSREEAGPKQQPKAVSKVDTSGWALEVPGAIRNGGGAQVELDVGVSEPVSPLTVATKKPVRPMITRRLGAPY